MIDRTVPMIDRTVPMIGTNTEEQFPSGIVLNVSRRGRSSGPAGGQPASRPPGILCGPRPASGLASPMRKKRKHPRPPVSEVARFVEDLAIWMWNEEPEENRPGLVFVHEFGKVFFVRFTVQGEADVQTLDAIQAVRKAVSRHFRVQVVSVVHPGPNWSQERIVGHVNDLLEKFGFDKVEGE